MPPVPEMLPRLVTYASSGEQALQAIAAGVDHLVLDHPRWSIRSWRDPDDGEWDLADLVTQVRQARAGIRLSINIDLFCRDPQLDAIAVAMAEAQAAGVDAIRVQDAGLVHLIRRAAPQLQAELATEMGNCCVASVRAHAVEGFAYQVLSNDWPVADLALLRAEPMDRELLVHGPVLLQYSDRRQLSACADWRGGTHHDPDTCPATGWQTVVVDGRSYPFADNPHGSLMYNTFDRSLYPWLDRLWEARLTAWTIDGRGQPRAYLATALAVFHAARVALAAGEWRMDETIWEGLRSSGERPFKPGFFLANNTDRCFEDLAVAHAQFDDLAEVVDVIRHERMTLRLIQDLPAASPDLVLVTPEGRVTPIDHRSLVDLHDAPVTSASSGAIVHLPWVKGAVPASRLRQLATSR